MLGIIVVKDIDLPPKAHADLLGNNSKYQVGCGSGNCVLLNSQSGIIKGISFKDVIGSDRGRFIRVSTRTDSETKNNGENNKYLYHKISH